MVPCSLTELGFFVWFLMLVSEARGRTFTFFVFFYLCKFECSGEKGCGLRISGSLWVGILVWAWR